MTIHNREINIWYAKFSSKLEYHFDLLIAVHFGSDDVQPSVFKARGSPAHSGTNTPVSRSSLASLERHRHSELIRDGLSPMSVDSDVQFEETEKMTSVLPTMWMGTQTGGWVEFVNNELGFFVVSGKCWNKKI